MQSTALRNSLLDTLANTSFAVATAYLSLHVGNPGITGANELTGGSYARQLIAWSAASGGAKANSGALNFTGLPVVSAATPITHMGIWSAVTAGTFYWAGPVGTQFIAPFTALNAGDVYSSAPNSLVNGDMVDLVDIYDGVIPTGVSEFTNYFVVSVSGLTYQLALTSGGAAIVISTDGSGMVRRIQPKTANAGDTLSVAISALTTALK